MELAQKENDLGWGDVLIGTHEKVKKYALNKPADFVGLIFLWGIIGTIFGSLLLFIMKGLWTNFW